VIFSRVMFFFLASPRRLPRLVASYLVEPRFVARKPQQW
jgi:hypothetical protein